nr:hypothetical protein [Clostridium folliculivorans]
MDNLAEWISKGVDSIGIGSLLTKGSKLQISENT